MTAKKRDNPFELAKDVSENPTSENISKTSIAYCKETLDFLFETAKAQGQLLWPDQAIFEMISKVNKGKSSKPLYPEVEKIHSSPGYQQAITSPDFLMAFFHELHTYAFKSFYKTYGIVKRGRRRLPESIYIQVLSLAEQGKTTAEQAKEQGLPIDTPEKKAKSKDVARHRRRTAKKRLGSK